MKKKTKQIELQTSADEKAKFSSVFRQIAQKQVVRKVAVGSYKIPDNFYPDRVRFRSRQAFFFHLFMTMLGAYTAVIFTSWIHITIDDINTGTETYDNTSIWARFIAVTLGVTFSSVKVFRAHYHYTRLEEENEDYRDLDESVDYEQ